MALDTFTDRYTIKVYDKNDNYIGVMKDITTDSIEVGLIINGYGEALTLEAGNIDYNIGNEIIKENNIVRVVEHLNDGTNPIKFTGFISRVTPRYSKGNIEFTLLPFSALMQKRMFEDGTDILETNPDFTDEDMIPVGADPQNFIVITGFSYFIRLETQGGDYTKLFFRLKTEDIAALQVAYSLSRIKVFQFPTEADVKANTNVIQSATSDWVDNAAYQLYEVEFSSPISTGQNYFGIIVETDTVGGGVNSLAVDIAYRPIYTSGDNLNEPWNVDNPLVAFEKYYNPGTGNGWYSLGDPYVAIGRDEGVTTIPLNSIDPSDMLRYIIDRYNAAHGKINYLAGDIEQTNTVTSYTFRVNTYKEAIETVLKTAPAGWLFYIDPSDNRVHFRDGNGASVTTHKVRPDQLTMLDTTVDVEGIINTVYFVGGDVSGQRLYIKRQDTDSRNIFGEQSIKESDNRVTNINHAIIIADAIIGAKRNAAYRFVFKIVGTNVEGVNGYDINSIKPGDKMVLGDGDEGDVWVLEDPNLNLEEFYLEFDPRTPYGIAVQVSRVRIQDNVATVECSTIAPDVTKRVEDIKRNLFQDETELAPDLPS